LKINLIKFHNPNLVLCESGFTLIELLVTIAIMSIVSSLAIVQYKEFKDRANFTVAIHQATDAFTAATAAVASRVSVTSKNADIRADGTTTLFGAATLSEVLPGFIHQREVYLTGGIYNSVGDPAVVRSAACHCRGSVAGTEVGNPVYEGHLYCWEIFEGYKPHKIVMDYAMAYAPASYGECS
jgi:prepilin-type N-terminal cleavage/methylation domain-containing protein